ncbi:Multidrug efflux system, membrane fusion component, partial [hydrothermal vent metagenome]
MAEKKLKSDKEKEDASNTSEVNTADPVRKISKYVLYVVMFLFVWYVIADRIAPWTDQARVQAYVVPIVAQVSGRVIEINVDKDQLVHPGDVLFKIDPADYELAVENAESALELAGQKIGAGTATVTTAQAGVVEAETNLEHMKVQSVRVYELEKQQVLSESDGDKARAKVKAAEAQLMSAHAQLEKAKQALGEKGNKNPRIRSAIAALKKTQLDLSRTIIVAPSLGGITNLQIDV